MSQTFVLATLGSRRKKGKFTRKESATNIQPARLTSCETVYWNKIKESWRSLGLCCCVSQSVAEESVVQLTPKRDRGKKDRGFLQPEVEQPAAAGRACIVPCLISRDYKFKAANFEGFTPSQKAKFPLICIDFLHAGVPTTVRREQFWRNISLYIKLMRERREEQLSSSDMTRHLLKFTRAVCMSRWDFVWTCLRAPRAVCIMSAAEAKTARGS